MEFGSKFLSFVHVKDVAIEEDLMSNKITEVLQWV